MMYLVLANLYLGIFYGFYHFFLRKETFFQVNRIYLLASLLMAFTLPLMEYNGFDDSVVYQYQLPIIELGSASTGEAVGMAGAVKPSASPITYLLIVYGAGCGLAALLVLLQVIGTIRILRKGRTGKAFSFFWAIRIDDTVYGSPQVVQHEQVHVRQWHSADIVLIQVVKIFNWFNPVVYFYERAMRLQHEYIADGRAAASDQFAYAELLLSHAMGMSGPVMANSFASSQLLKRRIAMLFRDRSSRLRSWRYAALLPIVAILLVFSVACNQQRAGGGNTDSLAAAESTSQSVDVQEFKKELSSHIVYREEAMRDGKQGLLAFTFEKTGEATIENITFLNEMGGGQEEEVTKALQLDAVAHAAPMGKSLVTIHFRISGADPDEKQLPPPPPPVSEEYKALGDITIVGYLPPPPPPVEPDPQTSAGAGGKNESYAAQDMEARKSNGEVDGEANNGDDLFTKAEIDPLPPGGMRAFMEYIGRNYDYPQEAIEAGVNGKLLVSFVVERDGNLTDLRVTQDLGYGTGEAAIRVLQGSSKWSPGIQNGRPVRVAYTLPIRLNLQQ